MKSPDFLGGANPPTADIVDTTPTFTLIRQKLRTVIVIDQSATMGVSRSLFFFSANVVCTRGANSIAAVINIQAYIMHNRDS